MCRKYLALEQYHCNHSPTTRSAELFNSLVKQVTSVHHSGKEYRDGTLALPSLPLTKKEYNKKS